MNQWHLEKLPGDVRREAEGAAQQAEMPLHRWLARIIRDTCAGEGIAPARELVRGLESSAATVRVTVAAHDGVQSTPEPFAAPLAVPAVEPPVQPVINIVAAAPAPAKAEVETKIQPGTLQQLVDGLRHDALSPLGEARLYLKLLTEEMASIGDITTATGRSREHIARTLRLLTLSDRLRELIDSKALTREQAFALLDAGDRESFISPAPGAGNGGRA
ncbi:MAG: ParB/RepB/Spo0J family partition protein [Stellaceae bacterium]